MRVMQLGKFYYPYMGGIENHLYLLCNELKADVQLKVVVSNSERAFRRDVVDGVEVVRCGELFNVSSTSICPTMPLELSRSGYDLLHIHFPHPMGVMSYLGSVRPRRHALVVSYHSDIVRQRRLKKLFGPFMDAVLRRADAIICTSPDYRDSSETLRPYLDKCEVIPYGIDLRQFDRTPELEAAAEKIRRQHPGKRIVAVGRLIYYKGFEYLIRAMAKVDATLLLIGEGPLRESLEKLAKEVGVSHRVRFLGNVHNQEIMPYYLAADVYALPSIARSEAFAIVQLEAMACGLPVINTALDSGVPFVSRHGESGLTVPPSDPEALALALQTLLSDDSMRKRFGAAGRARVEKEFAKEVMAARIRSLYERVTASSRAGGRAVA